MSSKPRSEAALRVRDLGEFGLIARLQACIDARHAGAPPGPATGSLPSGLEIGIGDDAAVWQPLPGARQVVTTDALIEHVHFETATTSWRDLGWKSLAVNVSDVAAMGAVPRYALVTLGLPGEAMLSDLLALYEGMLDLAEQYGVALIGGDVVSAALYVLSVTVIGETTGELLRRDAGRPGDLLAVTGSLGASGGGLRLLQSGSTRDDADPLVRAHVRPVPRVAAGAALVEAGLRCGMDVSDGLLGDTTHICERSGVAAVIETARVPVHPALLGAFGDEALAMAIGGGEDYELVCAGPEAALQRATATLAGLGIPLTLIGRLEAQRPGRPLVRLVDARGEPVAISRRSWDHFRG